MRASDVSVESDVARSKPSIAKLDPAFKDAVALYSGELFEGEESDWLSASASNTQVCMPRCWSDWPQRSERRRRESALGYGLDLLGLDRAHEGAAQLVMQCFGE